MAKKKKRLNLKKFIPFCLVCALLIVALVFGLGKLFNKEKPCEHNFVDGVCTLCGEEDPNYVPPDEVFNFSIVCAGDAMSHITNLRSQYNKDGTYYTEENQSAKTDGTFDFNENYTWIKEYIEAADLALVNIETTVSDGPNYSGRPGSFAVPDSFASALKNAGFDVAFTCNNHTLDQGVSGLKNTVEELREEGFTVVGTRLNSSENRSTVIDVKGVKIGIVAYTYETGTPGDTRTLNGSRIPDEALELLNSYRYEGSNSSNAVVASEDKALIANEIAWCKSQGAEFIIGYFHWDRFNEYVEKVTNLEKDLARFAAEQGVDVIFGSHPHVVQTMEVLELTVDGKEKQVPVYYSLGNFISNQNKESFAALDDPNGAVCQEELLAKLTITYNRTQGTITFDEISAVPLYVARYKDPSKVHDWEYRIFPLVGDYKSNADLITSGQTSRATDALAHITKVIGAEFIYK